MLQAWFRERTEERALGSRTHQRKDAGVPLVETRTRGQFEFTGLYRAVSYRDSCNGEIRHR
jgi:hypothetical protein